MIVDDGIEPLQINPSIPFTVIHPENKWRLGDNTQKRNMLIAMNECKGDIIAVIEDDDWYGPDYLSTMIDHLSHGFAVVGLSNVPYYNIMYKKYKNLKNGSFSPMGMTVFKRSAINTLRAILSTYDNRFDVRFWKTLTVPRNLISPIVNKKPIAVGIKGVPGRPGLGIGHNCSDPGWQNDLATMSTLETWIGADSEEYRKIYTTT